MSLTEADSHKQVLCSQNGLRAFNFIEMFYKYNNTINYFFNLTECLFFISVR